MGVGVNAQISASVWNPETNQYDVVVEPAAVASSAFAADVYGPAHESTSFEVLPVVALPLEQNAGPSAAPPSQGASSEDLAAYAAAMAEQLTNENFTPANEAHAAAAAKALGALAEAYNVVTAEALETTIEQWIGIGEQVLAAGTWAEGTEPEKLDRDQGRVGEIVEEHFAELTIPFRGHPDPLSELPPSIRAMVEAGGTLGGHVFLVTDASNPEIYASSYRAVGMNDPSLAIYAKPATFDEAGHHPGTSALDALGVIAAVRELEGVFLAMTPSWEGESGVQPGFMGGYAVLDESLKGWVQAPIYALTEINDVIDDAARAQGVPEDKLHLVREEMFEYDPSFGVLVPPGIAEAATALFAERHEAPSFWDKALPIIVGVGITVISAGAGAGAAAAMGASATTATIVGAGVGAAVSTAMQGGDFGDFLKSWAVGVIAPAIGEWVGGMAGGLGPTMQNAIGAVAGSAVVQLVTTGEIDLAQLAAAGVGSIGASWASSLFSATAQPLVEGTAKALATYAATGSVDAAMGAFLNSAISGYVRNPGLLTGTTVGENGELTAEPTGFKLVGNDPKVEKMIAVIDMVGALEANPNLTVRYDDNGKGLQTIDIYTSQGGQVTYRYLNGDYVSCQTNIDRMTAGIAQNMAKVDQIFADVRANPNVTVQQTNDYQTGAQQITLQAPGQPRVQYTYQDGQLQSVVFPDQVNVTNAMVADAAKRYGVPESVTRSWLTTLQNGGALVNSSIPASVQSTASLATVPVVSTGATGSGFLAVATIDGQERVVFGTAAHVAVSSEGSFVAVRDSMGRIVNIPFDGQTVVSTAVVAANGTVNMSPGAANTDGFLVTLSPETLQQIRPGVSLADLPRIGAQDPSRGSQIYTFGYAAWGNIGPNGQYGGHNLVGGIGTTASAGNGSIATNVAVNAQNPPATGGVSGGPTFSVGSDGRVYVVGINSMMGQTNPVTAGVNATLGTSFTSHAGYFTSLPWLITLLGGGKP